MQASIVGAYNATPSLIPPNQLEEILPLMPGLAHAEKTFRRGENAVPKFSLPQEQKEVTSEEVYTTSVSLEDILSLAGFIQQMHATLPNIIGSPDRYEILSKFRRLLTIFEDSVSLPARRAIAALSVEETLLYASGIAPYRLRPLSLYALASSDDNYIHTDGLALPDGTGNLRQSALCFPTMNHEEDGDNAWRYTVERCTTYLNTLVWLLSELAPRGELTEETPVYATGMPYPIGKMDSLLLAAAMVVRPGISTDALSREQLGKRHFLALERFLRRLRGCNVLSHPLSWWHYAHSIHEPCLVFLKQLGRPALPPTDYPVHLGFDLKLSLWSRACSNPGIWTYALALEALIKLLACTGSQQHVLYGPPVQQRLHSHLVTFASDEESENGAWPEVPGMKRLEAGTRIPGIPTVILCAEQRSGTSILQIPVLPGRNAHGLPVVLVPATGEARDALIRCYGIRQPGRLAVLHHTLQDLANPSGRLFGKAFQQAFPPCVYTGVIDLESYLSEDTPANTESEEQRLKNLKSPDMAFHEFLVF